MSGAQPAKTSPVIGTIGSVCLVLLLIIVVLRGIPKGLFLIVLGPALLVFWLAALVSCLTKEPSSHDKLCWVIVIVFLNALGGLLYWFIRRPQRIREMGR